MSKEAELSITVTAFARKTGDISVLSTTDLQIIALLYTVEVEANGTRRIRSAPGAKTEFEMEKEHAAKLKREARLKRKAQEPVQEVQEEIKQLDLTPGQPEVEEDNDDWTTVPTKQNTKVEESDTDSSDGEWITPSNVTEHKARDTGLISAAPGAGSSSAQKMEAACITGDFAMQNVGLQMGLNIVGSNGSKIRNVKTWVLRCHACYKCVSFSSLLVHTLTKNASSGYAKTQLKSSALHAGMLPCYEHPLPICQRQLPNTQKVTSYI